MNRSSCKISFRPKIDICSFAGLDISLWTVAAELFSTRMYHVVGDTAQS